MSNLNYEILDSSEVDLINTIIGWYSVRNKLTHSLVSLDQYEKSNKNFALLAKRSTENALINKQASYHVKSVVTLR